MCEKVEPASSATSGARATCCSRICEPSRDIPALLIVNRRSPERGRMTGSSLDPTPKIWRVATQRLQPFAVVVSCPGFCPAAVVRVPERYKEVADLSERANHARPIHTNKRRVMAATVRSSYAPPVATCMPKAIKTSPVVAAIVKESGADQESPRHNPIAATTYAKPARKLNQSTKFT